VGRARTLNGVRRVPHAVRQATQAVARSAAARGVSHLWTYRQPCADAAAATDACKRREQDLTPLSRRALKLGDTLPPGAAACIVRRFLSKPNRGKSKWEAMR
jgi:hypothetical protein